MKFHEFREKVKVKFIVDRNRYVVAKLKEAPKFSDKIFSIVKDKNEVTVIAQEGIELKSISEEKFFKLLTFNIKLPFDLSGFTSYISTLLANEEIPIFVISAYTTDHLFIKEEDIDKTIEVLKKNKVTLSCQL